MIQALLGKKIEQTQKYLENGHRVSVTIVTTKDNYVVQKKPNMIQLGFGEVKKTSKPVAGVLKKAGIDVKGLRTFKEIKATESEEIGLGSKVAVSDVFQPGDIISVSGTSKGKGFQGGVKRWGFKGGPRTHGQSDRERAPGSIGQTTTPGRVYKGKKMAGNMGNATVTIANLTVLAAEGDNLWISGLVPGGRNSILVITKTGEKKNFVPLWKEAVEEVKVEADATPVVEDQPAEAPVTEEKSEEVAPEVAVAETQEENTEKEESKEEVAA